MHKQNNPGSKESHDKIISFQQDNYGLTSFFRNDHSGNQSDRESWERQYFKMILMKSVGMNASIAYQPRFKGKKQKNFVSFVLFRVKKRERLPKIAVRNSADRLYFRF